MRSNYFIQYEPNLSVVVSHLRSGKKVLCMFKLNNHVNIVLHNKTVKKIHCALFEFSFFLHFIYYDLTDQSGLKAA